MATTTNMDCNLVAPIFTMNRSTESPIYHHSRHQTSASNDTVYSATTPSDALFETAIVGPALNTPQNEDEILTPVSVWAQQQQHPRSVQACTTAAHDQINGNILFGMDGLPLSTLTTNTAFVNPSMTLALDTAPSDSYCWAQPPPLPSTTITATLPFTAFDRTRHQSINNYQPPLATSMPLNAPKHMRSSTYAPMSTITDAFFMAGTSHNHPFFLQPSSFFQPQQQEQSNENAFIYQAPTLSLSSSSSDSSTSSNNSKSSYSNSVDKKGQEATSLILTNPFSYASSSTIPPTTTTMNNNSNSTTVMDPIDVLIASVGTTSNAEVAGAMSNNSTSADLTQQLLEHRQRALRFEVELEAKTAVTSRKEGCPVTYLNRNQLYSIQLRDTTQANEIIRSTLSLGFHLLDHRQSAEAKWKFRADHIKQGDPRIIDIEMEESAGISDVVVNSPENSSNLISFNWNGRFGATIYVKFMCLSTDFLETKGVKGIPLRAQMDFFVPANDLAQKAALNESCYAVVKLFRDKGAERKNKDNDRQVDKQLEKTYGTVTNDLKSLLYYTSLPKTAFQEKPLPPLLEAFEHNLNETMLATQQHQQDDLLLSQPSKAITTSAVAAVRKNHARSRLAPYSLLQRSSSAIRRT